MHDAIARLIHDFGAFGVGLAAGLEGETAVVIGGLLARHGAFTPLAAVIAAWLGSFAADQIFFALGRWRRDGKLVARMAGKPAFARALRFIDRHPMIFCIGFRFVYGLRVAGPVAIGVSRIPGRIFVVLNCLSAAGWAAIFVSLGYRYGLQFERLIRTVFTPAHLAILLMVAGLVAGLVYVRHSRANALAGGEA
jgi:membrane protein DedA with SNARE-associated domain